MSRTFFQLLVTYVLFFVLLLVVSFSAYGYFYSLLAERTLAESEATLEAGLESLEGVALRFWTFSSQQRTVTDFSRIAGLAHPFDARQLYWLESARSRLSMNMLDLKAWSDIVVDCAIVYPNEACVTLQRSFEYVDDYYGYYFAADGMDWLGWRTALLSADASATHSMRAQRVYAHGYGWFDGIILTCVSRAGSAKPQLSFLVLDAGSVLAHMVSADMLVDSGLRLMYRDDLVLTCGADSLPSGSYQTISRYSAKLRLTAQVDVSNSYVIAQLEPLRRIGLICLLSYVSISIFLTVFFSYRHSKPIRKLSLELSRVSPAPPTPRVNEYTYVEQAISRIESDLSQAQHALASRDDSLRAGTVERLLYGAAYANGSQADANALFGEFGLPFRVCIVRAFLTSRSGMPICVSALLEEALSKLRSTLPCASLAHAAGNDALLFILPAHGAEPRPALEAYCCWLIEAHSIECTCALSAVFERVADLPAACNQARYISRIASPAPGSHVFRHEDFTPLTQLPLSAEDGDCFYAALLDGNMPRSESIIHSAFSSARGGLAHSDIMLAQLFYMFSQIMDSVRIKLSEAGRLVQFDAEYSIRDHITVLEAKLIARARSLCVAAAGTVELRERQFAESVLQYIESNLSEPDLCARSVAEHFNRPERDIHAAIRSLAGTRFFDYVDDKRMTLAAKLLTETALPVSQISQACGFTLANSFYKAFKRRYGVAPSSYRA